MQPYPTHHPSARELPPLRIEQAPERRSDGDDGIQLITIAEAAARLGVSRSKLYLLIAEGELATVHIGRARRIDLADLRAFVDRHRAA